MESERSRWAGGRGAPRGSQRGNCARPRRLPPQPQPTATSASAVAAMPARQATQGGPQEIDIDLIEPSPYQPRTKFHEQALDELSRSIKASGIIQPLVVRPVGSRLDRKSTRLNSSHSQISYAVFCLKKKNPSYHTSTVSAKASSQCTSSSLFGVTYKYMPR